MTFSVLASVEPLPPALTGVLFAGLISATMSSADSNLLGAASVWANDLAPLLRRGPPGPDALIRSTRVTVLVIGLAATGVAVFNVRDLISVLKLSFSLRAAGRR
jgi:solute:Na+ symporter, SSS family